MAYRLPLHCGDGGRCRLVRWLGRLCVCTASCASRVRLAAAAGLLVVVVMSLPFAGSATVDRFYDIRQSMPCMVSGILSAGR